MADVIDFNGLTTLDINPDKVLQAALGALSDVVICGKDKNGDFYFASSKGEDAITNFYLDKAKYFLMND